MKFLDEAREVWYNYQNAPVEVTSDVKKNTITIGVDSESRDNWNLYITTHFDDILTEIDDTLAEEDKKTRLTEDRYRKLTKAYDELSSQNDELLEIIKNIKKQLELPLRDMHISNSVENSVHMLKWMRYRMETVHGEDPNVDYMLRYSDLIERMEHVALIFKEHA